MLLEITDNLEALQKEKADYYKIDVKKSSLSKPSCLSGMDNVYRIENDTSSDMQRIEYRLRELNPVDASIAAQVETNNMQSSLTAKNL
jgi:hypothetical protein